MGRVVGTQASISSLGFLMGLSEVPPAPNAGTHLLFLRRIAGSGDGSPFSCVPNYRN